MYQDIVYKRVHCSEIDFDGQFKFIFDLSIGKLDFVRYDDCTFLRWSSYLGKFTTEFFSNCMIYGFNEESKYKLLVKKVFIIMTIYCQGNFVLIIILNGLKN